MAINLTDVIHIAWDDKKFIDPMHDYNIFYRTIDDGAFSTVEYLSFEIAGDSTAPYITIDQNDGVHVLWNSNGMMYRNYEMGVWSSIEQITSSGVIGNQSIAVDSMNNTHISWIDISEYFDAGSDMDIFYKCKYGDSWTTTDIISTYSEYTSIAPAIVVLNDSSQKRL